MTLTFFCTGLKVSLAHPPSVCFCRHSFWMNKEAKWSKQLNLNRGRWRGENICLCHSVHNNTHKCLCWVTVGNCDSVKFITKCTQILKLIASKLNLNCVQIHMDNTLQYKIVHSTKDRKRFLPAGVGHFWQHTRLVFSVHGETKLHFLSPPKQMRPRKRFTLHESAIHQHQHGYGSHTVPEITFSPSVWKKTRQSQQQKKASHYV